MFDTHYLSADLNVEKDFRVADLRVDPASGHIDGPAGREQVDPRVMAVLVALARCPGELVTREHLLDEVWRGRVVSDETLTQCVYQLRGHLEAAGGDSNYRKLIVTLPKRGYQLDGNVEPVDPATGAGRALARTKGSRMGLLVILVVLAGVVGGGFLGIRWLDHGEEDTPLPAKSIAVLPFADFSPDGDQGYFADGFAEELIDVLAGIPGLRVIARTSSFSFRENNPDIPTIADKLDVAYVLEGSIRKSQGDIRITTQLVDAASNSHVWSETFDRELTDILEIQTEIAHLVADALHLTLSEPAVDAIRSPRDPEAYEHFLLGQFFWNRRGPGDTQRSERHFRSTVEIDPDFARAWVGLAGVYWLRAHDDPKKTSESLSQMGDALDQALSIEPDLPEAHARASALYRLLGDERRSREHWRRARELGPDSPLVTTYSGAHALRKGDYDGVVELQQKALEINPLSAIAHTNHGYFLMAVGRFEEANAAFDKADELTPGMKKEHDILRTFMLVLTGRHGEAVARVEKWPEGADRDQVLAKSYYALGRIDAAKAAVKRLKSRPSGDSAVRLAEVEAFRGRADSAFEWLARIGTLMTEDEKTDLQSAWGDRVQLSPFLRPLRDDPRWEPMIANLPKMPTVELSDGPIASASKGTVQFERLPAYPVINPGLR